MVLETQTTEAGTELDNLEDLYRLSPMQMGMLYHTLESPESGAYFEQSVFTIEGALDVASFERAWETVINRHSILRSSFLWQNLDSPIQAVHRRVNVWMEKQDWRERSAETQDRLLNEYLSADRGRGFDLEKAPLIRLALFQTADDVHKFVFSRHHLLLDRWSRSIVDKEVFACYEAFSRGSEPVLDDPRPYGDYISWIAAQDQTEAEAYWRQILKGLAAPTTIATQEQRVDEYGKRFDDKRLKLSQSTAGGLREFARQNKLTLNTIVQAAWAMLLSRYTGNDDVLFGVTMSGRSAALSGIESMVGLFINTLPLRTRVPFQSSVIDWLHALQRQQQELHKYEYCSLLDIHQWSEIPAGEPLFQSLLVFENLPARAKQSDETAIRVRGDRSYGSATGYPLTLMAMPGATLNLQLIYDPARFDPEFVGRMLLHLQTILDRIVADPAQKPINVRLLTAAEESLLDQWNDTQRQYERDLCVFQLIERQAAVRPNVIAVEAESQQLTYAELNARANQLASHLRKSGVGAETLVGVFLDRSADVVVALLGIHKAGGAYVPLDPAFPEQRVSFMVEDADLRFLLTNSTLASSLPNSNAKIVAIDTDWSLIAQESVDDLVSHVTPENLAYVIYTSGSTGNPKGVQIEHRALTNFISSVQREPGITPDDVLLAVTTLSFDIAGLEIFLPLTTGARLVIAGGETAADGLQLREQLASSGATVMQATPATWRMLIDAGWREGKGLKVLCGGEALSVDLADELITRGVTLWNMYGPTETTIWSTTGKVATQIESPVRPVSLGRPIANTRVYILDRWGNRVPIGVAGELHIGGEGLARGYLNLPELTSERFIFDSFNSAPGQRLYKTGDLARYLPDGSLEFLGRLDDQVKIRGFRIELGEIESVLRRHPAIRNCAVVAREDTPGEKKLVAYVVTTVDGAVSATALREFLSDKLPNYMLPAAIVELDELPLTPNAKVDRRALPAPDYVEQAEDSLVPPRTPLEELLIGIWIQVLKVPHIGINHNFFELGGHSLLAVSLISRARDALNVDLKVRDLFEAPTVAQLARKVNQLSGATPVPPMKKAARDGELPLSFAQERMWFLNQLDKESGFYNVFSAFKLTGALDVDRLQNACERITLRHEALRTTFSVVNGKPVQVTSPSAAVRFTTISLEGLSPETVETHIQRTGYEEARESFDLEHGPLLRVKVLRLAGNEHVVFLTTHHIVSDGWSMGILIKELAALYENAVLPELEFQYVDYAVWQREWLQNDLVDRQLAYWQNQLSGISTVLDLPRDKPRPAVQTFNGARHTVQLSRESTEALKELSRREGSTLFMTVLAAFKTLLFRYTDQENIIVGTPVAGRTAAEIENLIGFFVNTLPLKTSLSPAMSFKQLLARVRETALDAYANQDLPFEQLVDAMQPERDLSRTPLFQVAFAFQNAPREVFAVSGLAFERRRIENQTSKFDVTLFATEAAETLYLTFEYNTDLYEAERIERMMDHFEVLLEAVVVEPDSRIAELPLLTTSEREQVLVEWNQTSAAYPGEQCIQELFETQVERTPAATAVVDEKQRLTYAELDRLANQLAWRLRREGVGCESLVAVCLERSVDLVVALLGILKAGGAYVPLDPSYPQPRLRFMLEDTQAEVILTEQHLAARLPQVGGKQILIDEEREQLAHESDARPARLSRPESVGYVIYTSGSTGRPKGVAIEHRSTVALLQWAQRVYGAKELAGVLASTSVCFDLSVFELFLPLSVGGTVVIAEDALQLASGKWGVELSLINTVPSAMAELLRLECIPTSVRVVNLAGEPLSQTLVQQLYEQSGIERVYDLYGPTEDTTYSTYALRSATEAATIGRPIANTQVYLLDALFQPVPIGVAGELYLGGAGLARGYLKRPELTAEKFIPNPYGAAGTRLYRTGDLARYQTDGKLQYLGRSDQQVKVRGYRIELGEIEAAINEHPAVRESVVVVQEGSRIVAHAVLNDEDADDREQTQHLSQWQSIWDETYREDRQPADPRFNTIGWNSSYTGEPIPEPEMREWANGVAGRILALNPRTVLEIGCGTGLILFQVAPKCSLYYGTDVSRNALRYLEEQFGPGEFENVKLAQRTADDLRGVGPEKFDVVVLNSVVQYFPSIDYLTRVLRSAIDVASPDGAIFLGDIRCLPLLRALQAELQLCNAPAESTVADLQQSIEKQIALEKELVIDPAYFRALQDVLPSIGRVELQLKRGRYENELTKFRYDVVLHLGNLQPAKTEERVYHWDADLSSVDDLRRVLHASEADLLRVKGVPNTRLFSSLEKVAALSDQPSTMTLGAFRDLANTLNNRSGVEPEDFWSLGQEFPYTVEVTWSESGAMERFDVVLRRRGVALAPIAREAVRAREPNWKRFANEPAQSEPARDLLPVMRDFLSERLPQHMIPWIILELKELPLTANGKVDRAALSASSISKSRSAGIVFVPPRTPVEVTLVNIWAEVLRIERVGITDNFFELGGHSLLATQVISRVRERLGVNLPLRSMFESPTVAELSQKVLDSQPQSHEPWEVPIQKSTSGTQALLPDEIDQLSGDELDALLYQVLSEADREI